jgi:hypothetical protein
MLQFLSRKEREKARKLIKRMRTASMACAMVCGMGTAFVGIGIADMNMASLITGGIVVMVFMVSGFICEIKAEEAEADVRCARSSSYPEYDAHRLSRRARAAGYALPGVRRGCRVLLYHNNRPDDCGL